MEKLTKKQRHRIYKEVYEALKVRVEQSDLNLGFCNAYSFINGDGWYHHNCPLHLFEEYNLFCPESHGIYFFGMNSIDGHEIRMIALEFCIEMTK